MLIIVICAWHRQHFGWPLFKGVRLSGPLWPVAVSHGLCDVCKARLRMHAGPAPLGRLVAAARRLFAAEREG